MRSWIPERISPGRTTRRVVSGGDAATCRLRMHIAVNDTMLLVVQQDVIISIAGGEKLISTRPRNSRGKKFG